MTILTPKDKPLFTPGPLTTSPTMKQAVLRDLGFRDSEFITLIKKISQQVLALGGVPGFSFILDHRQAPLSIEGYARSLSLDLLAHLKWIFVIRNL